jgi:hypothetical protein
MTVSRTLLYLGPVVFKAMNWVILKNAKEERISKKIFRQSCKKYLKKPDRHSHEDKKKSSTYQHGQVAQSNVHSKQDNYGS